MSSATFRRWVSRVFPAFVAIGNETPPLHYVLVWRGWPRRGLGFGLIPSLLVWHLVSCMDYNYRPTVLSFETVAWGIFRFYDSFFGLLVRHTIRIRIILITLRPITTQKSVGRLFSCACLNVSPFKKPGPIDSNFRYIPTYMGRKAISHWSDRCHVVFSTQENY